MRINDFHNILELIKQDILQSDAEYLKLLRVVGNNQRYDFRSQLSIYDRNPEATACAKFDYWRERFNRKSRWMSRSFSLSLMENLALKIK